MNSASAGLDIPSRRESQVHPFQVAVVHKAGSEDQTISHVAAVFASTHR